MKKIIFVCNNNKVLGPLAKSLYNFYSEGIKSESASVIEDTKTDPSNEIIKLLGEEGYFIDNEENNPLSYFKNTFAEFIPLTNEAKLFLKEKGFSFTKECIFEDPYGKSYAEYKKSFIKMREFIKELVDS
jgi:protein-tyrosine-phosphatase